MPSANTLVRWVNEYAFASIVQARPYPTFGRPVHPRGRPHRLRPGTSPHALRIPPRDGHPALRDTFSPGQRGITPAFGYGAPHPSARGTSTLLNNALLSAHYEPLRLPLQPMVISALALYLTVGSPVPPPRRVSRTALYFFHHMPPLLPRKIHRNASVLQFRRLRPSPLDHRVGIFR